VVRSALLPRVHEQAQQQGTGVAALAEHLGLDASQVIAVGDAGNDHHMIAYAGLGVAMGNATDEIKALAQHTTGRNDEDGVASDRAFHPERLSRQGALWAFCYPAARPDV
jgi:3-deoxy-D-manno-octulosonate 8-phosphate phosphatase KdsC-like HAD superfamily phosphatase